MNWLVVQPFSLKQPILGWVAEVSLGIYSVTGVVVSPEVLVLGAVGATVIPVLGSWIVRREREHTPSPKG